MITDGATADVLLGALGWGNVGEESVDCGASCLYATW